MKYLDETTQTYKEISIKALDSMPIGSIIQFAGSTIPNGWMICDGSVLRVGLGSNQTYTGEYADLYKVIGTTYGYVDYPIPLVGAIDFKIPDLRGKVPIGQDGNDTDFEDLGNTGGSKELQAHSHVQYRGYQVSGFSAPYMSTMTGWGLVDSTSGTELHNIGTAGTGNSGNLQPYLVVNYIIKVKNTTPTMASVVNDYNNSTEDSYSCNFINTNVGVVESGSNYIKYADGTMICYGHLYTAASDITYGDFYGTLGMSQSLTCSFPQAFINTNYQVTLTANGWGTIGGQVSTKSTDNFNYYGFTHHQFATYKSNIELSYIAIGKWK